MHKILYFLLFLLIVGCGSSKKKTTYVKPRKISVAATKTETASQRTTSVKRGRSSKNGQADDIIDSALEFSGVRYKFGGTTRKGMDCSGLLYVAFGDNNVKLPRTSYHMAEEGKRVNLNQVEKGDLLFFKTTKRAKRINHVGMVVTVKKGEIKFVHASSSRGVIVSSMREGYWSSAFVRAKRVL